MVAAEIVLILIGLVMIGVSFYITEKLSQQDIDQISLMSEKELKVIAEKQVKSIKNEVETSVNVFVDEALEVTQRGLERETNNKIMAVSEYSDTVLENINKTHNEIMFLYSMLNDKQTEAAELVSDLQRLTKQIRDMDLEGTIAKAQEAADFVMNVNTNYFEPIPVQTIEPSEEVHVINETTNLKEFTDMPDMAPVLSKNEQILLLYKEGKDEVEIAKALNCGLGEVRLVIGLYNEA